MWLQEREHEWLFVSPEGQGQVAQGCSAKRVVIVSLNRGHDFGSLKAVQEELSPLVLALSPIGSRQSKGTIPFMTTQEGIGSRSALVNAFFLCICVVCDHVLSWHQHQQSSAAGSHSLHDNTRRHWQQVSLYGPCFWMQSCRCVLLQVVAFVIGSSSYCHQHQQLQRQSLAAGRHSLHDYKGRHWQQVSPYRVQVYV